MLFQFAGGRFGTGFFQSLARYGFIDAIFPFVLVFTIVYGMLRKIRIFGQDASNRFDIIIALVTGTAFVYPHISGDYSRYGFADPVVIINQAIPQIGVIIVNEKPTKKVIRQKILGSDIIYVGGGNTMRMLQVWRKKGVDKLLERAYKKGVVLSGLSAGAICWFKYGSSDSLQKGPKDKSLCKVKGMDLINAGLSPHHIREPHRKKAIKDIMKKTSGVAIALDDCCAIEIIDDQYRFITSKKGAKAHKVYHKSGKVHYKKLEISKNFAPLELLMKKD